MVRSSMRLWLCRQRVSDHSNLQLGRQSICSCAIQHSYMGSNPAHQFGVRPWRIALCGWRSALSRQRRCGVLIIWIESTPLLDQSWPVPGICLQRRSKQFLPLSAVVCSELSSKSSYSFTRQLPTPPILSLALVSRMNLLVVLQYWDLSFPIMRFLFWNTECLHHWKICSSAILFCNTECTTHFRKVVSSAIRLKTANSVICTEDKSFNLIQSVNTPFQAVSTWCHLLVVVFGTQFRFRDTMNLLRWCRTSEAENSN